MDIHLLDQTGPHVHRIIFHHTTPAGDSPAGVAWSLAIVNRHKLANDGDAPATALPIGDGTAGTITQAEADQIAAGEVIEASHSLPIKSGGDSLAEIRASARAMYATREAELFARLSGELDQFGRTDSAA